MTARAQAARQQASARLDRAITGAAVAARSIAARADLGRDGRWRVADKDMRALLAALAAWRDAGRQYTDAVSAEVAS